MPELIVAITVTGVLGCFAFARTQAIRSAYELFREKLLGFFGDRGSYQDYESFLALYRADIEDESQGRSRGVVQAWIRFLDAVRIAQNERGKTKFEGSEKALDKLAEDLRLAFPHMSRWQYVSPMVLSAIGVLGGCFILLLAALGIAEWQNALVYVCLMICAGVAGMLLLKIYEQYTTERVERRIRIVTNHLKRHLIMRTEKDYLLETGRAIQDELASFKEITSLLNLRVKRLADEQPSAEVIAENVQVDLEPMLERLAQFDKQLRHHLQDNKLIQNQQVGQLRDTLVEFFDHDRSQIKVGVDTAKNVEQLLLRLGTNMGRNQDDQDQLMAKLEEKLDKIITDQLEPVGLKEQFDRLSHGLTEQLQSLSKGIETAKKEDAHPPRLSVVATQAHPEQNLEIAVPIGIYEVIKGVKELLDSAERSCSLVVEQKKYLGKTLRQLDEMGTQQVERFSTRAPAFAEALRRGLKPVAMWHAHTQQFKPVTGRLAAQVSDLVDALLKRLESETIKPGFKKVWLNAEELRALMVAGESLNAELGQTVRSLLKLQKNMISVRESLLFLETVSSAEVDVAGANIVAHLSSQLKATLRQRGKIKFNVNHYARDFVPKVRAIKSLVEASADHFEAKLPPVAERQSSFKVEYTRAS